MYGFNVDATEVNTIENKIMEQLERDPAAFLTLAEDSNLVFKSLVSRCLDQGILEIKDGGVKHGEMMLGHDRMSAAETVMKDEKLTAILKAKLSGDMKILQEALKAK